MMSVSPSSPPHAKGATKGRAFGMSTRSRWQRLWVALLLGVLALMLIVHAVAFETFTVPSPSMEPTLHPGDRIVVDKLAQVPRRGQVVVFSGDGSLEQHTNPDGFRGMVDSAAATLGFRLDETDFVKRIIGVGGDRLSVGHDGVLRRNGRVVDEPYLAPGTRASLEPFSLTVPAGTVFVMGDNRADSNDSRDHLGDPGGGFVPVSKIIGTVSWRYWHG